MQCCYNTVNFLQNLHKKHPRYIARPLGRGMVCILWVQTMIYTLPQSQQWCMQYHMILDREIVALDCICMGHAIDWPPVLIEAWITNTSLCWISILVYKDFLTWLVGGDFSKVVATFNHMGWSLNFLWPPMEFLNYPIFSNLGLCTACWAHFMCHHELCPTSVSHPFSSLNSSLGLTGEKLY